MKYYIIKIILLMLISVYLNADNIDNLLMDVQKKSDLSQKTKLANAGVSFVWTRDDLDRMQITNLKQILKTLYPAGYAENRYGLVDPLSSNANQPFMSSVIRLYIDNQEITTGLYGSGIIIMGDANIDWVDHVEIYTQNPTYEYATESTITLIKLYSKSVAKDEGNMLKVSGGSYGAGSMDGYSAGWIKDWSYFVFGLGSNDKRKKYYSHNTQLSRDRKVNALVATLHKEDTNILLNTFTQDRDAFMNLSLDSTPLKSKLKVKYFHLGIDSKIGDFSYLFTYSYSNVKEDMIDDVTPIPNPPFYGMFPVQSVQSYTHSMVFTGELKYKYTTTNNTLLTGLKYRTKRAKWDKSSVNGVNMATNDDSRIQNIVTTYIENQYSLSDNSIVTAGAEYERVENKNTPQSDNLFMYRLGHTYTTDLWTFKTFYSHTLSTLEPYLVKSDTFLAYPNHHYNPATINTIVEDIIYEKDANKYELILDYSEGKNYFLPLDKGKIVNYNKKLIMSGIDARWTYIYHKFDKLFLRAGYRELRNSPDSIISFYKEYIAVARNINTYKKFDIFNELVYRTNNYIKDGHSCNYSAGVKYNYNDSISFSIKGINLFDNASKEKYIRINKRTFQEEEPLLISPIDREIRLSARWVF